MTKIEYLNSFFIERLMSVAGEIFEAVKDTVFEYEEEIERTKRENYRLREILTQISLSSSNHSLSADVQPSDVDGTPLEQSFNQRPLNSDPALLHLKLQLATLKQESEPQLQLNDGSRSTSPCAKSVYETWTSHADGVCLEQPNRSQDLQNPEPSLIQVKLELATIQEENGPQQQLGAEKHTCGQKLSQSDSHNALEIDEQNDARLCGKSFITVKLEPLDSQAPQSSASPTQFGDHLDSMEPESGICPSFQYNLTCDDLANATAHSQSYLTEEVFSCGTCGKLLRSSWLLKKHMIAFHKERPYRCDLCGKSYGDAHVLKVHLKTHSNERPFQCESCGKMYKKKSHLKDHERTHTGDKRYSCSACGMCFIWTNQVKVHIQNHHPGQLATVIKKPLMQM